MAAADAAELRRAAAAFERLGARLALVFYALALVELGHAYVWARIATASTRSSCAFDQRTQRTSTHGLRLPLVCSFFCF